MPRFKSKVGNLSAELNPYSATFTGKGYTLAGESRDDGSFAVTATRGSVLVAVGEGMTLRDAVNDLAGRLGLPGSPAF